MDLDIIEQVQGNIIGNCLCVLGDSMAMPVGVDAQALPAPSSSSTWRRRASGATSAAQAMGADELARWPRREPPRWPGPSRTGSPSRSTAREVRAPEGAMLVDAAKHGDVEIPYFCYEPKLGQPVGACRMCLVEIEGIPKLQTSCSTAGARRDGRQHDLRPRASTRRTRSSSSCSSTTRSTARSATRAASARCRTSPTAGAPAARASSSPSATSRSRSSCRRWWRSTASAASSATAACASRRRWPRTTSSCSSSAATTPSSAPTTAVPTSAPFSGNIIELCPVGALTSHRVPLPRAARGTSRTPGTRLHALPVAVQRQAHDPRRRQGRARARARQRRGRRRLALRQGPLRLPVLRARRSGSPRRWCATAATCARCPGSARSPTPPRRSKRAGARHRRLRRRRRPPTRRASSSSTCCARGSARRSVDSRAAGARGPAQARALARPDLSARVSRHRPRRRDPRGRHRAGGRGADPRPARAQGGAPQRRPARGRVERGPSTLDPNADRRAALRARRAPRRRSARWPRRSARPRARARSTTLAGRARAAAGFRPGAPQRERRRAAPAGRRARRGRRAARRRRRGGHLGRARLRRRARRAGGRGAAGAGRRARHRRTSDESGLIGVPAGTNGRGLREVGCLAGARPGPHRRRRAPASPTRRAARCCSSTPTRARAGARARADVGDRVRPLPQRGARASTPTWSSRPRSTPRRRAPSPTPTGASSACARRSATPARCAPGWSVLAELCERARRRRSAALSAPTVTAAVAEAVPFYAGLTLDEIGGRGVRWQDRDAASALAAERAARPSRSTTRRPRPRACSSARAPTLWGGPEIEHSPSLRFLATGTARRAVARGRPRGWASRPATRSS